MVRLTYLARQALGRSAFEPPEWEASVSIEGADEAPNSTVSPAQPEAPDEAPPAQQYVQQYNIRGHPENLSSRSLARRSRRAQNNILSTVGVCVSVDQNGKILPVTSKDAAKRAADAQRISAVMKENEVGLWIGFADDVITLFSTTFVLNLRARIQTFQFYAGVPLMHMGRIETRLLGAWAYLGAGSIPSICFDLLDNIQKSLWEILGDLAIEQIDIVQRPREERNRLHRRIRFAEATLSSVCTIFLLPLQFYASLQRLGLVPAWPLLLNPLRMSFTSLFTHLAPSFPTQRSARSITGYLISIATSPVVAWFMLSTFTALADGKALRYAQLALPKPGYPDHYSLQGSTDEDGSATEHAKFIKRYGQKSSLLREVKRDTQAVIESLSNVATTIDYLVFKSAAKIMQFAYSHLPIIRQPKIQPRSQPQPQPPTLTIPSVLLSTSDTLIQSPASDHTAPTSPAHNQSPPGAYLPATSTTATSPQLSLSSDLNLISPIETTNVQRNTRSGSTETLHMQVEVNSTARGAAIFSSSFSASPRAAEDAPETADTDELQATETYTAHVTALSLHPSSYLAKHAATAAVTLLRLPLEALFFRSLARAYLRSAANTPRAPAAAWLLDTVHPPEAWIVRSGLGRAGAAGWAEYWGKMALCVGADAAVGFVVWDVGVGVAWIVGRRFFRWGRM